MRPLLCTALVYGAEVIEQLREESASRSRLASLLDGAACVKAFADGSTGVGASVAHNYGNIYGTGDVRLTVSDGKGGTVSDTRPVTVGNLTGDWSGSIDNNIQIRASFQQASDGSVTGTWSGGGGGVISVTGGLDPAATNRIDGNANFKLRFKITKSGIPGGLSDFTFEGRMDTTTGNTLTGSVRGSGFGGEPMRLDRTP